MTVVTDGIDSQMKVFVTESSMVTWNIIRGWVS